MTQCNCLKTDGNKCTREVSSKPNSNNLYCWQHQSCTNPQQIKKSPEITKNIVKDKQNMTNNHIQKSVNKDRIYGMYIGCVLGDVLGAPYEFRYSKVKYTGKVEHIIERNSKFQGLRKGVIGEITDDTEMTIAILKSLANNNNHYVRDDVILNYIHFANNCSFLGNNTRKLFTGIKTLKGYQSRFSKLTSEDKEALQSNGCLMRASALALATNLDVALEDYSITNPNKICKDIVDIYVRLIRLILDADIKLNVGDIKNNIIIFLVERQTPNYDCDEKVKNIIKDVLDKKNRDITSNKGWIFHAFYCALFSLLHIDGFTNSINYVIRLGGDTDTNGAIAGALIGCLYGRTQLEIDQKDNIEAIKKCDLSKSDYKHSSSYEEGLLKLGQTTIY